MFFKRYKSIISKITLIVMVFASLAPTISHALVFYTGNKAFSQQICTANGIKIVIQVTTTMGKQFTNEFITTSSKPAKSMALENLFEHCPFCLHHASDVLYAPKYADTLYIDKVKQFFQLAYLSPILAALHRSAHPSRAPPFPN